ncbi:MAG: hypothetical protein ABIN10_12390, partial [Specibacter sp.]
RTRKETDVPWPGKPPAGRETKPRRTYAERQSKVGISLKTYEFVTNKLATTRHPEAGLSAENPSNSAE